MKLFNPCSWSHANRIGFQAAWKIGLPVAIVGGIFQFALWYLLKSL